MALPASVGRAGRLVAISAAIFLIAACSAREESGSPPVTAAEFVGSSSCQTCHASEYADWSGSHHELAMQPASPDTVLGDFSDTVFEYFGEQSRFRTAGGQFYVRTLNASAAPQEYRVTHTFGVEPLQQYLVEFPGGRLQALPFLWDTRAADQGGQRWLHLYPDEHIAPGDELHWTGALQNWNYMCAECHSTDVVMDYEHASRSFNTKYAEVSVGCEACHGPGSLHVAEAGAESFSDSRLGLVVDLDDQGRAVWTMNPATGIAERSELLLRPTRQPEACGRCHSRRSIVAPRYEYGRPLADTHRPSLLEAGLYFADGQINDEVYVYGSFLQSRMYRAGVTCSDCHDPHTLELVTGSSPDDVCAQCHLSTRFAAAEHTGHDEGAVGCVDCHMVSRTYMIIDPRRDHSFRVPRPDVSDATGTPNACNGCHIDRDAAWAADAIDAWHGSERRPEFATALHAGRIGSANAGLIAVFREPAHPGIARATALSLLTPPFAEAEAEALDEALYNPDPLIRGAALRVHRFMPPEFRLQTGTERIADPVRSVRLEAVLAYAELRDALPAKGRGDFGRAADEYRASQNAILNRPEAHVSLGDLEAAIGNIPAAIGHYEAALDIEPNSALARVNLADLLRRIGDDARGKIVLEEGIRRTPEVGVLHHSLGLLLVRAGQKEKALEALGEAARLEPGNARYAYVLELAESDLRQTVPD